MGEHHSGTVHLTGQAQPEQPDPENTKVVMTGEDLQTIANIWLEAGRKVDEYTKSKGWGHHPTVDVLRAGPKIQVYYDAAHHGQPDLTLEEATQSVEAANALDAAEAQIANGETLSAEEMIAALADVDPALAALLEGIVKAEEPKPES